MHRKPKGEIKYRRLVAYKLLVTCSLTLFFAMAMPIIIVGFATHDVASWFQRSGSIILGLCIYVEFNLMVVRGRLSQNVKDVEVLKIISKLQTWQTRCSTMSKICLFIGFLIFGYGDLIYDIV